MVQDFGPGNFTEDTRDWGPILQWPQKYRNERDTIPAL